MEDPHAELARVCQGHRNGGDESVSGMAVFRPGERLAPADLWKSLPLTARSGSLFQARTVCMTNLCERRADGVQERRMPIVPYVNHVEPSEDAVIWRCMDMRKFRDLMASQELYFRRADLFTNKSKGLPPEHYARRVLGLNPYDINDRLSLNHHLGYLPESRGLLHQLLASLPSRRARHVGTIRPRRSSHLLTL